MSEQYCLFDEDQAADSRPNESQTQEPYIPVRRGKFYKITLNNSKIIIETGKSMMEIINEIRSRAKVSFTQPDGKTIACASEAIRHVERIDRWELARVYGYAIARTMATEE